MRDVNLTNAYRKGILHTSHFGKLVPDKNNNNNSGNSQLIDPGLDKWH